MARVKFKVITRTEKVTAGTAVDRLVIELQPMADTGVDETLQISQSERAANMTLDYIRPVAGTLTDFTSGTEVWIDITPVV